MASRWLYSIQYLYLGMYFLPLPAGATAVADTKVPSTQGNGAPAGMIDFPSLELVVLVGVVVLALVLIARSGKAP